MMHDLCGSIFDALNICDIYYQKNNNNKYDLIYKTLLKASKHLKYEIYEYTRTREGKNGNVKRKTKLKDFKADTVIAAREKKSEH